jgi:hypothetical protein
MNVQGILFRVETIVEGMEKGEFHERINMKEFIIVTHENSTMKRPCRSNIHYKHMLKLNWKTTKYV